MVTVAIQVTKAYKQADTRHADVTTDDQSSTWRKDSQKAECIYLLANYMFTQKQRSECVDYY